MAHKPKATLRKSQSKWKATISEWNRVSFHFPPVMNHFLEKLPRLHSMRCVMRAGIHATRLLQMRAQIARRSFLLDRRFLPPGMLRIFRHHFERVQIDVPVRAIPRAKPASDASIFNNYF